MTSYKWLARLTLLTPLLLIVAVFFMGGGHGWYEPAIVIFPFGFLGSIWRDRITTPFMILAILQFPVYGIFLDKYLKKQNGRFVAIAIFVVHMALVGFVLILKRSEL